MRPLLCGILRGAVAGCPGSSLRTGLRSTVVAGTPRRTAEMEATANDLRELDERPIPRADPALLHQARLRRHGTCALAHISDPHQAARPSRGDSGRIRLAGECLNGYL